jgi:outer membrane protein assembly factor BamD (BamD/ComL family)
MLEKSNWWRRGYPLVVVSLVLTAATAATAQQARTRKLTYDAQRKDWVELPPPPAGTPEGDLRCIRVQIKEGKHRRALSAIKRFVKTYGRADPQYPATLLAKAEALIGRREYYKAYGVVQEFMDAFGGMALTSDALRLKFVIAETYLTGLKRKIWGVRLLSGVDLAFRILDEIAVDHPDSRWAVYAVKTKADYLFHTGDHALAELEYARLLKDYPRSRYVQPSMRRSADAALASFRGIEYDEAALIEADERYRDYLSYYPLTHDTDDIALVLDGIQEQRAEKDFSIGQYYQRTDHLSSAIFYYRSILESWPETIAATKAGERLDLLGAR